MVTLTVSLLRPKFIMRHICMEREGMALTAEERSFVYKLFLETENPSRIFRSLYERKKALNRRFSIATMCKACQIPSRGYLSEFLNGKRRLNDRYWKPFIKYFG